MTDKPASPAAHYVCNDCGQRMRTWQDMEEYQHDGCGGLVELDAVVQMRNQRDTALARVAQLERERIDISDPQWLATLIKERDELKASIATAREAHGDPLSLAVLDIVRVEAESAEADRIAAMAEARAVEISRSDNPYRQDINDANDTKAAELRDFAADIRARAHRGGK